MVLRPAPLSIVSCTRRPPIFSRGGSNSRASRGNKSSSRIQATGHRPVFFSVTTTATFSPISAVSRLHSREATRDSDQFRVRKRLTSITASSTYIAYASKSKPNTMAKTSSRIAPASHFISSRHAPRAVLRSTAHGVCLLHSRSGPLLQRRHGDFRDDLFDQRIRRHFAQPAFGPQDDAMREHGGGDFLHIVGQHVIAAAQR